MCYGAFCLNVGQSLSHDTKDQSIISGRRQKAGCIPRPNRCSTQNGYAAGYQCDEFPFASTVSNGGTTKRVNRCVPLEQNSSKCPLGINFPRVLQPVL